MRFSNGFGLFALALAMGLLGGGIVSAAHAMPVDGGMGLQEAATPVMHDLTALHDWLLIAITAIVGFVLLLLIIVMVRFNSRAEARAWWEKLPPAKKQEHIQKNGNQSVLKMLRVNGTGGTV